jgi:hypothetical protein
VVEVVVVLVVGFHELITASFHPCAVALYWLSGADVPFLPCYVRPYLPPQHIACRLTQVVKSRKAGRPDVCTGHLVSELPARVALSMLEILVELHNQSCVQKSKMPAALATRQPLMMNVKSP